MHALPLIKHTALRSGSSYKRKIQREILLSEEKRSIVAMASTKALIAFAVLLAAAFLVAASADETQANKKEDTKVDVQDYWRGGGHPRGGGYPGRGGGYPGGGWRGGGYPGGGWRGCRCCGYGYRGGCRCCASPDEIPEPMYRPEVDSHN